MLLWLVRDERLDATGLLATEPDPQPATEPDPVDDAAGQDHQVRPVVVPREPRLATPEDLARAAIRQVEPRRPRTLYTDRLLLRIAGPVCDCDVPRGEQAAVRRLVGDLVDEARPTLESCLAEALAEDPRVLVKAPALLVVQQAMAHGPLVYAFTPTLDVGPHGTQVHALGWQDEAPGDALHTCMTGALEAASAPASMLTASFRVQVPLVAFSQRAWGLNLGGFHGRLALEAAALGWQHYVRGDHETALELFRDGYWVYHLAELRYLEALALEQLGRHTAAARAYAEYLEARPYAPEAPSLPQHIARLRARASASP